jgi:hypothetical protein
MMRRLQDLLDEMERDPSLDDPDRLRDRIEALDRLDAYLQGEESKSENESRVGDGTIPRARAIYSKLEAANRELYERVRFRIQQGDGIDSLRQWLPAVDCGAAAVEKGLGYDYLDELIGGVLQFPAPAGDVVALAPEMVFYQPTPARHIFDLIGRTALTEEDLFIDLGSGLGHVPLLVSICTRARCIGIELQTAYVDCARRVAEKLNLSRATFIQQDVRAADLSHGTVFYLYTPFTGSILRVVLASLRREGESREIRICSFGPCATQIAEELWLQAVGAPDEGRITMFRSRN